MLVAMSLWIVGAGGLGREVADAGIAAGRSIEGFVDEQAEGPVAGLPVVATPPPGAALVVAIGDAATRRDVVDRLLPDDDAGPTIVHPTAVIASRVLLGAGSIVLAGAVISVDAAIGAHAQVHYGATVGHDTRLGRCATVLPGANLAGAVTVGAGVLVGSNAVVLQGLDLGDGCTVGAGAVVTRDVPPGITVVGTPARPL